MFPYSQKRHYMLSHDREHILINLYLLNGQSALRCFWKFWAIPGISGNAHWQTTHRSTFTLFSLLRIVQKSTKKVMCSKDIHI